MTNFLDRLRLALRRNAALENWYRPGSSTSAGQYETCTEFDDETWICKGELVQLSCLAASEQHIVATDKHQQYYG